MLKLTLQEKRRFWRKVQKTASCWNWQGYLEGNNRGSFTVGGRRYVPTEIVLALEGQFRKDGLLILHRCDNKACINPDHLYWGTQFDNMRDRSERHPLGWKWSEESKQTLRDIWKKRIRGSDYASL